MNRTDGAGLFSSSAWASGDADNPWSSAVDSGDSQRPWRSLSGDENKVLGPGSTGTTQQSLDKGGGDTFDPVEFAPWKEADGPVQAVQAAGMDDESANQSTNTESTDGQEKAQELTRTLGASDEPQELAPQEFPGSDEPQEFPGPDEPQEFPGSDEPQDLTEELEPQVLTGEFDEPQELTGEFDEPQELTGEFDDTQELSGELNTNGSDELTELTVEPNDDDFADLAEFNEHNEPNEDTIKPSDMKPPEIETLIGILFPPADKEISYKHYDGNVLDTPNPDSQWSARKLMNQLTRPTRQFVQVDSKPDPIVRWRASAIEGQVLKIVHGWQKNRARRRAMFGWRNHQRSNSVVNGDAPPQRRVVTDQPRSRPTSVLFDNDTSTHLANEPPPRASSSIGFAAPTTPTHQSFPPLIASPSAIGLRPSIPPETPPASPPPMPRPSSSRPSALALASLQGDAHVPRVSSPLSSNTFDSLSDSLSSQNEIPQKDAQKHEESAEDDEWGDFETFEPQIMAKPEATDLDSLHPSLPVKPVGPSVVPIAPVKPVNLPPVRSPPVTLPTSKASKNSPEIDIVSSDDEDNFDQWGEFSADQTEPTTINAVPKPVNKTESPVPQLLDLSIFDSKSSAPTTQGNDEWGWLDEFSSHKPQPQSKPPPPALSTQPLQPLHNDDDDDDDDDFGDFEEFATPQKASQVSLSQPAPTLVESRQRENDKVQKAVDNLPDLSFMLR